MRLSRDWLSDYVDLAPLSIEELSARFTEIGHAVESIEEHEGDTVFDLEITTNRVDAMSHLGMAREVSAALGRELRNVPVAKTNPVASPSGGVTIRIEAPQMCARYTGLVIRGVTVKESPQKIRKRLEAVGLRPINNVVDVTNYVMLALGHPLHAFDLAKVGGQTIVVRTGRPGEKMKSLDGIDRPIDPETVVIADASRAVALGGIIGGEESEIGAATRDVLLECAWFNPSVIRRTARRLGIKTDASYRFERRVDPEDTLTVIELAAAMIVELAGGTADAPIDVIGADVPQKKLRLRATALHASSGGVIGMGYALELLRRIGFAAELEGEDVAVVVPSYRGDIFEEADLVEEVLRFYGLNNIPASLPRLTTGDVHSNPVHETEDRIRSIAVGSGLSEVITYSFIHPEHNALFSAETPITVTNALTESLSSMRLSLIPGLLETAAFNRSYGTRDGALFEVGRTYHDTPQGMRERSRIGIVMYGSIGSHWSGEKRPVDFFDVKGVVEQIAARLHVSLSFSGSDDAAMKKGSRAAAFHGDRKIATLGFLAPEVLHRFGIKGDVAAAEVDIDALLSSMAEWKMAPVARFPGVPMILAITHGRDLDYERIVGAIQSMNVPHLHEVGLRDRFVPEGSDAIKTTLGMWYQAFDRSLTQEEVGQWHHDLATRLAELLPVTVLS